ncbi:hypothetical protein [Stella sp.]|uniref:hypothetical protein n=1 Tax=Stella sp. TaxID=2912054 RepID=UPI0035B066DA
MAGPLGVRAGWAGASMMVLALVAAAPPAAHGQLLSQRVQNLTGEVKALREQLDAIGRQLEAGRHEDAVTAARRQATEQSLRDWVTESIRRTERMEELSAAGDQRLAAAAAASEAGVRAAIDQVAQRLGRFEAALAGLAEIERAVGRLDAQGAAREKAQTETAAELGARIDQARIIADERIERLERETAERFRAQEGLLAGLRDELGRIEQGDAARLQAMDAAADEVRRMIAEARDARTTPAAAQDPQLAERVRAQDGALAEISQRVARLDAAEAERGRQLARTAREVQSLVDQARSGLATRIDGLDQKAAERAQATAEAAEELRRSLTRVTDDLAERLARVEQGPSVQGGMADARLERLLGAAVHLSAITQTARPFARELAYVRQIGEGVRGIEGPINELLVHASRGAPTVADLRQSFDVLAPLVVARATGPGDGWTDTARRWAVEAGSKFGVVDPPPPTAARAAVQNAEIHLARGQLAQAVAALAPLDAAALSQAATWIIHARSRIAIDQAATELVNRVMAQALTR